MWDCPVGKRKVEKSKVSRIIFISYHPLLCIIYINSNTVQSLRCSSSRMEIDSEQDKTLHSTFNGKKIHCDLRVRCKKLIVKS